MADTPAADEVDGYIVIALGVDGEHDGVHYQAEDGGDGGLLDQATASLTAARDAVHKVSGRLDQSCHGA